MNMGTVSDLRPGDLWSWGQQGSIEVFSTMPTDDGRLSISGRIVGGRDHGKTGTWTVPEDDWAEWS